MYNRKIGPYLRDGLKRYPIVTLTGPRQSGKTTLVRSLFPEYEYRSLEDPDVRSFALEDPRGFLGQTKQSLILDEIQKAPQITSFLQTIVDDPANKRQFVLTGSHSMLLLEAVSQSLAGRTKVFELLPLANQELGSSIENLNVQIYKGGYPRIYDRGLDPTEWHKEYFRLYVERDVRQLTQIQDLDKFERFVRLCAGRTGQLLNLSSLGIESGVSQPTAQAWLAALKASYVVFTLQPHFRNFNRRVVKTPKIYFYDTGLASYLLQVTDPQQLDTHPLRGSLFENWVISEMLKRDLNQAIEPHYYFWRDQKGHETDLVKDFGTYLYPTEIKMSQSFQPSFIKNLEYLNLLQERDSESDRGEVIWASAESLNFKGYKVTSWKDI